MPELADEELDEGVAVLVTTGEADAEAVALEEAHPTPRALDWALH
jgi:hypothetical protein